MNTRLLNDRETAEVLGIGKSTLWRWAQKGIGPKPVRLSAGVTRWRKADIENFINSAAQPTT